MFEEENEQITEENQEEEPQITSENPTERKLARRLRIQRRLDAIRKQNFPEGESQEEICEKPILTEQLLKSSQILEKLLIEGEETVTNVRVASDVREIDRKEEESLNKEKILDELEQEARLAIDMFNEIMDKWAIILQCKDPLEMNEGIMKQKEKCNEVFAQKNGAIAMLKEEIKKAEIKFARDQRKQNEDIENLSKRIEQQIILMKKAYRNELELIEEAILSERKTIIQMSDKKYEELYKKRDQEEETIAEEKEKMLEDFWEMCRKVRVDFQEKYRQTKIKLESDIQLLQQEFEKIKFLTLCNGEKLDYNYQILKKREDENIIIKSQQKRKITKLQDQINDLRRKTREYQNCSNSEIEQLTKEVHKLQKSVLETEDNADYVSKSNDLRYHQIWEMNRKKAQSFLNKIISTDKILYEQLLGLPYDPSQVKILEKTDLPSYQSAIQVLDQKLPSNHSQSMDESANSEDDIFKQQLLNHILKQIGDKCGFLIESKLKDILTDFSQEEQILIRIDCVFSALSITKPKEIEALLEFFLPYSYCPSCTTGQQVTSLKSESDLIQDNTDKETNSSCSSSTLISENMTDDIISAIHPPLNQINEIISQSKEKRVSMAKIDCWQKHPLFIKSSCVLRALKGFVTKYYNPQKELIRMSTRLSHQSHTLSRLIDPEDVELFWKTYKDKFSGEREELWDGLKWGLQKYHEILKERKKVNDDIVQLKKENGELKRVLAKYRNSCDNERLCN